MAKQNIPDISPLIEKWHPQASLEEKKEYTADLRRFVAILYALHQKCDADSQDEVDSRESETHAILESDNSPPL